MVDVSKLPYMGGMRSEKSSAKTSSTPKTALIVPFDSLFKKKNICFFSGFLLFGKMAQKKTTKKKVFFFIHSSRALFYSAVCLWLRSMAGTIRIRKNTNRDAFFLMAGEGDKPPKPPTFFTPLKNEGLIRGLKGKPMVNSCIFLPLRTHMLRGISP